jgi:hypothetical protein
VILIEDLRKYGAGLHIGQLGWTVPNTTDGYKWIDVQFDNGPRLPILTFGIQRIVPELAEQIARGMVDDNRGTRFDADPEVAIRAHDEWLLTTYSRYIATDSVIKLGEGDEEVYGFTFPSLQSLASVNNEPNYPVKVGFTTDKDGGAFARIRGLMVEPAGFPERPNVLFVCRTWNGRALELAIHSRLRAQNRRIKTAPGNEWFKTNAPELIAICNELRESMPAPELKPLRGGIPTLAEIDPDEVFEISQVPNSASIRISIGKKLTDSDAGSDRTV